MLVSKQRGTTTGVLHKVLKMVASRQSVARLRTFLLTLLIVSRLYPSGKLFAHCTSESIELGFSLKIIIFFFVALIDGMVPIFHAFLDDNGHLTSVNSARYLSLLQSTV